MNIRDEVLRLMANGLGQEEIAQSLCRSGMGYCSAWNMVVRITKEQAKMIMDERKRSARCDNNTEEVRNGKDG